MPSDLPAMLAELRRRWVDIWDRIWVPFYCRFAWFHLMRAKSDGHFIIVYDRNPEPQVEGYYIESSSWTPAGCRRAASNTIYWDALVEHLGRENILNAIKKVEADRAESK